MPRGFVKIFFISNAYFSNMKNIFRIFLLVFIASVFLVDICQRLADFSLLSQSYHQKSITIAFRSAFGVFELIMIGIMAYFIRKFPARRIRLLSLLFFHVVGVLMLPMMMRNFTYMAILYPWPQTLLLFDHATPYCKPYNWFYYYSNYNPKMGC
jgi:hypothetical protein